MPSFHPLQTRRVTEQGVGKVCIHAALGEKGEERIVDPDRRHAGEPVGGKVRRQANVAQFWVIVTDARGVHAVYADAAGQKRGWRNRPVVLRATVLGVREVDRAVTLIAADDRW